jgi:two-component system cell cycle sensor histidine kinase/response regulator CckA
LLVLFPARGEMDWCPLDDQALLDGQPVHQQIALTSVGQVPMDRLRSVFDGMFDGVWLVGADGKTTYANEAMARLLGYKPAEMPGRPMTEFLDEPLWPEVEAFLARQRELSGERMELKFRRRDGEDLFGLVAGSPIATPAGVFVGTMLNVSDMSGKRAMDAQVIQTQRLEAIGQFAGGIAHDFNNLLTTIHGFTELAQDHLGEPELARSDLAKVLASAEKASAITRKLLAFTRRQVLAPVDVDPAQVVADLVPILGPLLGDDINIALDIEATHAWVRVDPTQLEQIMVNLAVNARDAMPDGGTVSITIHNLKPTEADRPDPDLSAGPYVRISVSDTGTGMDEGTKSRIFDPFYTTKGPGKGTGLGLSTVFGIVSQSGGQVEVETALGHGSTFHVDLPRVDGTTSPGKLHILPGSPARLGVILLVEDEPLVRQFVETILDRAGYVVLSASHGDQALATAGRWAEGIDVLLTDIVMPGVHGLELAARLRVERPRLSVVFMSGHAADVVSRAGEIPIAGDFLPKPFSVDELLRAIARAIDRGRAGDPA